MKESKHQRWIYEWFKRQNRVGDTFLWQQWTQTQVFQNHFHWRWSSKTIWWRVTSSLLLGPLLWVISIHSYLPGYMVVVSLLLIFLGCFDCSRKVIRSSLEPTGPVHQKKEYLCCQRFISVQSSMYSVETRMQGTMLKSLENDFPKFFIQITYITLIHNIRSWDTDQVLWRQSKCVTVKLRTDVTI